MFAWLAFFALTCQLVLSFGHVHIGKLSNSPGESAVLAYAGDGLAGATPSSPHKNPKGLAEDFCAICASISIASTLVVPDAPATVPPISFVRVFQWTVATAEPLWSDHFPFDARGPPQA
jgi:hypothetical protein